MPNVVDSLGLLKSKLLEIQHLRNAAALLSWDQETYMPAGGGKARAWQTDQKRNCEEVESTAAMPPLSVRTLVFE